jgi:hypothetical protein
LEIKDILRMKRILICFIFRKKAHDMIRNDKLAFLLDKRQEHDQREINRAVNEFRALHQQPDARREWDLQDPDYLKKDKPARVTDDDPRCGPASIQKFEGEDLAAEARRKYQQEQLREWSKQQVIGQMRFRSLCV